jgi:SanA protein
MKRSYSIILTLVKIGVVVLVVFLLPFIYLQINYRFLNKNSTSPKVAIVFGAGLINSYPSKVLASRLDVSLVLYKSGSINKILVSGDNPTVYYNEPKAMTQYLVDNGVNELDIIQDYAGRKTVDTCYRAKNVFNISSAYIISQPFHLPRALYLCEKFGINTITKPAKNLPILGTIYQYIREIPSSFKAMIEGQSYNGAEPSDGSEVRIYE